MSDRSVLLTLLSFCVCLLTLCLLGHDCQTFMSDRSCLRVWFWSGDLHVLVNVSEVVFGQVILLFWSWYVRLSTLLGLCLCIGCVS